MFSSNNFEIQFRIFALFFFFIYGFIFSPSGCHLFQGKQKPEILVNPSLVQIGTLKKWALAAWTRSFPTSFAVPLHHESSHLTS